MSIDLKDIKQKQAPKAAGKANQKEAVARLLQKDISLFGTKIKDKKKERFFSDLAILLSSGIDFKTALELVVEEQKNKKDRELYEAVKDDVLKGKSLWEAIESCGKFTNYEYFSIKIGEESGRLTEVLQELQQFYSRKIRQKRQIVNSLSYPLIVLITAIGALIFMLNFIVPMFEDVLKQFNGKLPAITEFIIGLSGFFSEYGGWLALCIAGLIVFLMTQKNRGWYRKYSSLLFLRLPFFGGIMNKIYTTRFCQAMALLIASHTPMVQALQLVKNMINFYPFEKALDRIATDVIRGKALHQSMSQFNIFEHRMTSLVKVAEEVNQLDVIFDRLNKQYSEELEHRLGILSSILEPVMIILVGLLVGTILVSMYVPLFQMGSTIK